MPGLLPLKQRVKGSNPCALALCAVPRCRLQVTPEVSDPPVLKCSGPLACVQDLGYRGSTGLIWCSVLWSPQRSPKRTFSAAFGLQRLPWGRRDREAAVRPVRFPHCRQQPAQRVLAHPPRLAGMEAGAPDTSGTHSQPRPRGPHHSGVNYLNDGRCSGLSTCVPRFPVPEARIRL